LIRASIVDRKSARLHVEPTLALAGALAAAPALAGAGDGESPPPQEASTTQSAADAAMRPWQEKAHLEVMAQG